ncbi:hypothetical protein LPY66_10730 [Dehalobacter sp. DCM]|uniref:hypothetical protein n=1 Tax=Dehalobacter sp. DCM TaxID=2907827 RepID=UPI00308157A4|nr:hypothetical protein LPY66_10730 [Dehalobacter sp. DCM]
MRIERVQLTDLPTLRDKLSDYPEKLVVLFFEDISRQKLIESTSLPLETVFNWPESSRHDLYRRVMNLQHVGSEELSPAKMWDSLKRAAERVEEQAEGMAQVKKEYDALRSEWEADAERLEHQRALQIKIKRLQVEKDDLSCKIAGMEKIHERLQILKDNPDYPDLRKLKDKMTRLEQTRQESEEILAAYSQDPDIDWDMVDKLREETYAWAELKTADHSLLMEIIELEQDIDALADDINHSRYAGLPVTEGESLNKAEAELSELQAALATEREASAQRSAALNTLEKQLDEEREKLRRYTMMVKTSAKDGRERSAREGQQTFGKALLAKLGLKYGQDRSEKKGASRLKAIFQRNSMKDNAGFSRLEKEYQDQVHIVKAMQAQWNAWINESEKEKKLISQIEACSQRLRLAYASVNASGHDEWQRGWEEYQQQQKQLAERHAQLEAKITQQEQAQIKINASAEQIREKLKGWTSEDAVDELLAIIQNIALNLRLKEVTAEQYAEIKNTLKEKLNKRDMNRLSAALEPFDDVQREGRLSVKERNAMLIKTKQQLDDVSKQMQLAAADLKKSRSISKDPELDQKLDAVKQQWLAFYNLQQALSDTKELLENCLDKWQFDYGIALKIKAKQIVSQTFALPLSDRKELIMADAAKYYFAYRQALLELASEDDRDCPIFFFTGQMNETTEFWDGILRYYQGLSLERPVFFGTTNSTLWQYIKVNHS